MSSHHLQPLFDQRRRPSEATGVTTPGFGPSPSGRPPRGILQTSSIGSTTARFSAANDRVCLGPQV
jgi:hypothetical protein